VVYGEHGAGIRGRVLRGSRDAKAATCDARWPVAAHACAPVEKEPLPLRRIRRDGRVEVL
jgi:hypothetical protein